jgi:L-alanine-DL-glutamate epimerase-like enolase superfamily enzyme
MREDELPRSAAPMQRTLSANPRHHRPNREPYRRVHAKAGRRSEAARPVLERTGMRAERIEARLRLAASPLRIPLRTSFRHASAERASAESVWVEARRGLHSGAGEGCPRDYVTGEEVPGALDWIERVRPEVEERVGDVSDLRSFVAAAREDIDRHPAAWCAIELALLDLFGREGAQTVEDLLGLPRLVGRFRYTAVVGAENGERLDGVLGRYLGLGFRDFKIKISGEPGPDRRRLDRLREVNARSDRPIPELRVRLDANNAWAATPGRALDFLRALDGDLLGVEEPLAPRDRGALLDLATGAGVRIILDESLARMSDVALFTAAPGPWIGNLRVSKMGGLLRTLEVLSALREAGVPVIVGAHVGETSVLTRAALTVAHAAGDGLLAQEGAFGEILILRDPVEPSIRFGPAGVLEIPAAPSHPLRRSGLGLRLQQGGGADPIAAARLSDERPAPRPT